MVGEEVYIELPHDIEAAPDQDQVWRLKKALKRSQKHLTVLPEVHRRTSHMVWVHLQQGVSHTSV
eukprot:1873159-Amphidinium_carterae.1